MTAITSSPNLFKHYGKVAQDDLQKIPCAALRTLVNEGFLTPDASGIVDLGQLDKVLNQVLGVRTVARAGLVVGAKAATKEVVAQQLGEMHSGKFNVYALAGSVLDHQGDTRILRDGFSQERMDWLLGFANKTTARIGMAEISRAQAEAAREPGTGLVGRGLGIAELTALIQVFGTRGPDGKRSLSASGLEQLYKHATLPDEFRAQLKKNEAGEQVSSQRAGLVKIMAGTVEMAFRQAGTATGRALMGLFGAAGREKGLDETSAQGLALSICPAGPPVAQPKDNVHKGPAPG